MKQLLVVSLGLLFYALPAQAQQPASPSAAQAGLGTASAELVTLTKAWTNFTHQDCIPPAKPKPINLRSI
jgi:hypothetical protein